MSKNSKDFKDFADKLDKLINGKSSDKPTLTNYVVNQLGGEVLRNIKERTPRDTGELARGWTNKQEVKSKTQIEKYVKNHERTQNGKTTTMKFINPVEYAVYVENGHRTRRGEKSMSVPRWIEGAFMARDSIDLVQKYSKGLIEIAVEDYFEEFLK